eukprot:TRINITY_DN14292_c0_g1_i1.p1 TRINITY_DN14292_c0_g1~~TRINITY_DN14292_c0_g1_i1.p1  ORF type:complete len:201 (-),score=67.08 TRINITY_DN14292_c0_g1_i1:87-689(-)
MVGVYLLGTEQYWWITPVVPEGQTFVNTYPTAVVVLFSQFEFPTMAIAFALGYPFTRMPVFNPWLVGGIALDTAANAWCLFQNFPWFSKWYQLPYGTLPSSSPSPSPPSSGSVPFAGIGENPPPIPYYFRFVMLAAAVGGFAVTVAWELAVRNWVPRLFGNTRVYNRDRFKRYQRVEQKIHASPGVKVPDLHVALPKHVT